ncbi:MAG: ABC transporter permease [Gemmatimonadota bacterium]|nr:ABC transporter permease [Gemmatimonadota bacterium]
MISIFNVIGARIIWALVNMGQFFSMVVEIVRLLPRIRAYWSNTTAQMIEIGLHSLPIILFIAFFSGMVTAVQTGYQFQAYVPLYLVGSVVLESVVLELAPVLGGLVLSGRVGAKIAAEIGTMKVTEQIDAMEVMAMNPYLYLAVPRILAGMVMVPVLVVFADLMGVLSGMVVAVNTLDVSTPDFIKGMRAFWNEKDAYFGIAKAFSFGLTITSIACYQGFKVPTNSGAEGVGAATTNTVVVSCLVILVLDYVLANALLYTVI